MESFRLEPPTNIYVKAPTEAEMDELIMSMDPDNLGKIDFSAFFSAYAGYIKPVYKAEDLKRAYNEIAG